MNKGENRVKWIKGQRVNSLGHLERMREDRMPKKIFTQELEGTKRRGRPRIGWREVVERDLRVLGVRRWRRLVTDRTKWRDIFRQAKAQTGCSANGKKRQKSKKITRMKILETLDKKKPSKKRKDLFTGI